MGVKGLMDRLKVRYARCFIEGTVQVDNMVQDVMTETMRICRDPHIHNVSDFVAALTAPYLNLRGKMTLVFCNDFQASIPVEKGEEQARRSTSIEKYPLDCVITHDLITFPQSDKPDEPINFERLAATRPLRNQLWRLVQDVMLQLSWDNEVRVVFDLVEGERPKVLCNGEITHTLFADMYNEDVELSHDLMHEEADNNYLLDVRTQGEGDLAQMYWLRMLCTHVGMDTVLTTTDGDTVPIFVAQSPVIHSNVVWQYAPGCFLLLTELLSDLKRDGWTTTSFPIACGLLGTDYTAKRHLSYRINAYNVFEAVRNWSRLVQPAIMPTPEEWDKLILFIWVHHFALRIRSVQEVTYWDDVFEETQNDYDVELQLRMVASRFFEKRSDARCKNFPTEQVRDEQYTRAKWLYEYWVDSVFDATCA